MHFSQVLHDVATFYAQIMQTHQARYGVGTVTFTHNATTEQIQIGVNIPSQYVLAVYLTIEHRSGHWYINNAQADVHNIHAIMQYLFRRVHIGTLKTLEFLESKQSTNKWTISYDAMNTIHLTWNGVECRITINQNVAITDTALSGILETKRHRTAFTSLEDIKALIDTTNNPMDIPLGTI